MDIKVVIGANAGDEGKGLVSGCLARQAQQEHKKALTVFYNGTIQRAHSFGDNLYHCVAAGVEFGSDTFYHPMFVIDPIALWLKQVKENSNEDIVISLVGNKEDNYEYEDIDNNNIELFVNQINCLYKKVSAKSGFGIENLFYDIGLKYLEPEKYNIFLSKSVEYKKGNISLSDFSKGNITQQIIEEDKKNCCL